MSIAIAAPRGRPRARARRRSASTTEIGPEQRRDRGSRPPSARYWQPRRQRRTARV